MKQSNLSKQAERVLTLVTWGALLVALGLVLPAGLLYWWTGSWGIATLRSVAALLPLGLVLAFGAGFWFGKTEVRGFLAGFDRSLDGLSRAVDLRDNARIRTATAKRQLLVYFPTDAEFGSPLSSEFVVEKKSTSWWENVERTEAFRTFDDLHGNCSDLLKNIEARIEKNIAQHQLREGRS